MRVTVLVRRSPVHLFSHVKGGFMVRGFKPLGGGEKCCISRVAWGFIPRPKSGAFSQHHFYPKRIY